MSTLKVSIPAAEPPSPRPVSKVNLSLEVTPEFFNLLSAAATEHRSSISGLVSSLLGRVLHLSPSDPWFVVDQPTRQALQSILGGGTITTPEKLLFRVKAMSLVKIGTVQLHPSEGQLESLKRRARANKREEAEELKRAFEEAARVVFGYV